MNLVKDSRPVSDPRTAVRNGVVQLSVLASVTVIGCQPSDSPVGGPQTRGDKPETKVVAPSRDPDPAIDAFVPILPNSPRFADNPALLQRLVDTPHGYFRFINIPFSQAVCHHYGTRVRSMPTVNLHGDAHVEQYTVTEFGVGLSDFDDSSFGPAVLDLLRFATSLRLVARERDWPDAFDLSFGAFLDGYGTALRTPDCPRPSTQFAERAQASFEEDRTQFLDAATAHMRSDEESQPFAAEYARYRTLMETEHPDLRSGFFNLKRSGRFRVGVGSALDEKYLLRIDGPSESPSDDVILEAKQVRDISEIDCIYGTSGGGAFRILTSQSRIGEMPHRFLAQVPPEPGGPPGAPMFWVHEWVANYHELRVAGSIESPDELAEVARDVGIQLGRGHTRAIASPLDSQLRRAQLSLVDDLEDEIRELSEELTQRTVSAWEWFRSEAEPVR